jgi:GAF domain-containing protein
MSKRGVSVLLMLAAVIALGALVQDYRFDRLIARERAAVGAMAGDVHDITETVLLMQGAQRAYVATGQSASEWYGRVSKTIDDLQARIEARRTASTDANAIASYWTATETLNKFRKLDGQIRTAVEQHDVLHASDLIFMDGATTVQKLTDTLKAAQARDQAAIEAGVDRLGWMRSGLAAIGVLFVLGVALYFGRAVTNLGAKTAPTMADMIRNLPPAVKTGVAAPVAPAPAMTIQLPPVVRPANLVAAAELCVDLGRVMDAGEVPVLLDRAASVLDAKGLVLWAIDSDGSRLHPSLCQGYSERVVQKLRPLSIDSDNVTSLAFRSTQPQTMNGASQNDAAAIAVPLMSGSGCVGVLAAELRHSRPPADLMPVARIIGAQFSTLITPREQPTRRSAQA